MTKEEEEAKAKADAEAKAKADAEAKAKADAAAAAGEGENQNGDGDGDEFDKERALETIRKQRESEKKLAKDLKDTQARLKQYEDAEKAKQDAEKTELQKAQDREAKLKQDLQEAQETAQALRLRQEFGKTAAKLALKFASVQAEDDAFELAEMDGVEIDANGKVTGLEDAVKELQKSRPYLFAQAEGEGDGQGTPKRNGKTNGKLNQDAVTGVKVRF